MVKPICCDKPAKSWRKEFGRGWNASWIEAMKCKRCGRWGIPFMGELEKKAWDLFQQTVMQPEYDRIREAGMVFDLSLGISYE